MVNILVTGGNGQLANSINSIINKHDHYNFIFLSSSDLDISSKSQVDVFFSNNQIDWCINCAAYTAVDNAELEYSLSEKINSEGAKNLALACKVHGIKLIHISTDFVFDGLHNEPYKETDTTHPINVYGQTKLKGENEICSNLDSYFIIRTSWLYSEFGNNFMKTMLRLASERDELRIVNDQIGTPTYAVDLATVILKIISLNSIKYGIYHYSNDGFTTWYDFANEIFGIYNIIIKTHPIPSIAYPTPAKRPKYSVLDKSKIKNAFDIEIPHWKQSLKKASFKLLN